MDYIPKPYQDFKSDYPDILEAYQHLANKCHEAGPLDEKTRRLIKLGIAVGTGSEGAIKSHARRAIEIGISQDEIKHASLLALTTIGFPSMIAAWEWIKEVIKEH